METYILYCMILVYKLAPFFGEIKKKDSSKGEIAKSVHEESSLKTHDTNSW